MLRQTPLHLADALFQEGRELGPGIVLDESVSEVKKHGIWKATVYWHRVPASPYLYAQFTAFASPAVTGSNTVKTLPWPGWLLTCT